MDSAPYLAVVLAVCLYSPLCLVYIGRAVLR